MSKKFTRRERRAIGAFSRRMHRYWEYVRSDIGDERVNSWYMTGDLKHLGDLHSRELISLMGAMNEKMRRL